MYMYIVYTLELVFAEVCSSSRLYGSALYPIYDPSPFFYLSHLSPSYPSLPLSLPPSYPSLPLSLPPPPPPPLSPGHRAPSKAGGEINFSLQRPTR